MGAGRECRHTGASRGIGGIRGLLGDVGSVRGHWGPSIGIGGCQGYWGLAGSVGTQGPAGV